MSSHQPSRRERRRRMRDLERRMAELDAIDARYGLGASPLVERPRRRRSSNGTAPALLVSGLLTAGIVVFHPSDATSAVRNLLGLSDRTLELPPPGGHRDRPYQ